jgi:hypothetical protein
MAQKWLKIVKNDLTDVAIDLDTIGSIIVSRRSSKEDGMILFGAGPVEVGNDEVSEDEWKRILDVVDSL